MKWFTHEWEYDMTEAEYDAVPVAYDAHRKRVRDALPVDLQMFAEAGGPVSLHDARIISTFPQGSDVELNLAPAVDDDEGSQALVHIVYRNAEMFGLSPEQWRWRVNETGTQIMAGEVDVLDDGRFEHRISFSPSWGWAYGETMWVGFRFPAIDVAIAHFRDGEVILPS